ncbi:MAG: hypothetical protein NTZ57_05970, partial [Deltaproteobacteria bacterium]|nr:hypothetical protein [Deltaproteobacteria bacterium]
CWGMAVTAASAGRVELFSYLYPEILSGMFLPDKVTTVVLKKEKTALLSCHRQQKGNCNIGFLGSTLRFSD